ncbi:MAG: C40 family peptidase [Clostridiales bacterium]|nr:C40 family peptidase [Clostridiales bacterium]
MKKPRHRLNHGDDNNGMIRGAGSLAHRAVNTVTKPVKHYLRHELDEADQDNAAIQSIKTGTDTGRMIHASKRHENVGDGPHAKAAAETKKHDHPAQTERQKKDRIKAFNRKRQNKQTVMKRREGKTEGVGSISDAVKRVFSKSYSRGSGASSGSKHKGGIVILSIGGVFLVIVLAIFGGAAVLFQGGGTPVVETTYGSSDADIYAAENELCRLEDNLNSQINSFEKTHPGYDEYEYQIDEIEHNPYALTSYLEARYGAFTMNDSIKAEIGRLFKAQYTLTVSEKTEKRTRMETMNGTRSVYDEETGQWKTQEYTYEQEVEYDYHICYCTLTNKGFESIAAKELNDAQSFKYNLLTATMGNRTYLFDTSLSGTYGSQGKKYEIPPEALSDAKFANMIREAEKYLGMPYVVGGKSVKTGFDCSGFVCWVLNHCGNGWNVGQKRAKDLCSMCIKISPAQAKPGDLIFFEKTYDTTGASHVGIYVGNGMMIHCGNPIKYSSINTRYFKEHFLCFGRLPFNQ